MAMDRYVSFAEQVGAVAPPLTMPLDGVSESFRQAIWNLVSVYFTGDSSAQFAVKAFGTRMASDLNSDPDVWRQHQSADCLRFLKRLVMEGEWHFCYDLLCGFPRWNRLGSAEARSWFRDLNSFLEGYSSPYRWQDERFTPITDEHELASVTSASQVAGKYAPAATHLSKALTKFSLRPLPDYENSVKEAASAVESAVKVATGESDIGAATRLFASKYSVHKALMESANKLFGYASDRAGVRHAATEVAKPVDFDEAKLAIVSASAWVNFVAAKAP